MDHESNRDLDELFELLQDVQETGTNVFEILDLEDHEKRLTRFLAWLLDPNSSHDAGSAFIDAFLDCFDINATTPPNVEYLKNLYSTEHGETEVDLLIETESRVIGVEIKTTHTESQEKFEKEADAVREYLEDHQQESVDMLYLPHRSSEVGRVEYTDNIATWQDVIDSIRECRGELESGQEIALFDNFITTIQKHVIPQEESFSKETELYLKYKNHLEDFEIDINANSYKNDRKDIYNLVYDWFDQNYNPNRWDGQLNRERKFSKNTQYIRIYKDNWHFTEEGSGIPDCRLEIQGTEKRLSWYNSNEGADAYRPDKPHFEMTLVIHDGSDSQKRRNAYQQYLGKEERELLRNSGFQQVEERLSEADTEARYNNHHMYSKIIPIDFTEAGRVVREMKDGLQSLVALEDTLDKFTTDMRDPHC